MSRSMLKSGDSRGADADRSGVHVACGGVNVGKSGKAAGRLRAPPCGRFRREDRLSRHWRPPKGVFRHASFAERLRRDGVPEPLARHRIVDAGRRRQGYRR